MVQYFLAQHGPQDQLRMSAESVGSQSSRWELNQEELESEDLHSSEDSSSSNSQEVVGEEGNPGPSNSAPLLSWNSDPEPSMITLMPLSNGAVGSRTGGTPTKDRTVRKKYLTPPKNGLQKRDSNKRTPNYTCKACHSQDIGLISGTPKTGSKRKRSDRAKYMCKSCGCLKLTIRHKTEPTTSSKLVDHTFAAVSDSDSEVQFVRKKIKVEQTTTPNRSSSSTVPSPSSRGPRGIEDSIDHFAKYVTSLLRTLPRKKCIRIQKEVISLVLESQLIESESSD